MKSFKNAVAKAFTATALVASVAVAAPANAAVIQLGFILDRSGSIGSTDWGTITTGLSNAINALIPVGGTDTYEISVVSFASTASTDVNAVLIGDAATRTAVAAAIAAIPFSGGGTSFGPAFTNMTAAITGSANYNAAGLQYVNFSTDGVQADAAAGTAARAAMLAAGIDNISIEGIGGGVDVADLTGNYCFPQPCDQTAPYNFPAQGFYVAVANAAAYQAAINNKIATVVGRVPEPATAALLGLGLLGLGALRRRKAA